jgi:hypothetical protein
MMMGFASFLGSWEVSEAGLHWAKDCWSWSQGALKLSWQYTSASALCSWLVASFLLLCKIRIFKVEETIPLNTGNLASLFPPHLMAGQFNSRTQ